ncbi:MAG: hypothetical protein RL014_784 [Pseudomonadota bacterium]
MLNVFRSRHCAWLAVAAIALGYVKPESAHATPDGKWSGKVNCSTNILNGSPAYTQDIAITINGASGSVVLEDAQTRETFELRIDAAGVASLASNGAWKSAPDRKWVIRAQGRASGSALNLQGQMYAGDGRTVVRDRCLVELSHTAQPTQGAATAPRTEPGFSVEQVGPPELRSLSTHAAASKYPGIAAVFPEWLLPEGQPWAFRAPGSLQARPLGSRAPTAQESRVIDDARRIVETREVKVIVLVDGDDVVHAVGRRGLTAETPLPSASVSKTVTAVAIGKAICDRHLQLQDSVGTLIPSLRDTPIGQATIRDALLMSTGSAVQGHGVTAGETTHYFNGGGSLEALLATSRFLQVTAAPGKTFIYKSIDPYLVSVALQRATRQPFTSYFRDSVLAEMLPAHPVVLDTDKSGNFLSTGGVRMSLADWVRFATYVRDQRSGRGCFADYLQDMSRSQIRISKVPGVNGYFNGYGFLTWTENDAAPSTFWAVGHFGQRIGWSNKPGNRRVFLTFGFESDADMAAIYALAHRWLNR